MSASGRAADHGSTSPQSLLARIIGVLRRPTATLEAVIGEPRVAGVLIVTTVAAALAGSLLMRTETGRQALVDQWERTALAFGQPVDDARYATFEAWSAAGPGYAVAAAVATGPVVSLLVALLVFGTMGRRGETKGASGRSFRQVFAVVAHAGVILALKQVIAAPLGYLRETTASATALGVWFPMLDEAAPAARLLGLLDVLVLWWIVVLAIGVALLYGRRASRLALGFVGIYVGLALVGALIMAAAGDAA